MKSFEHGAVELAPLSLELESQERRMRNAGLVYSREVSLKRP